MLDLLNTIVQWFVSGVTNIINIITSIPTYINYVNTYLNMTVPAFMLPFILLGFTAIAVIAIKRLIL